MIAARLILAVFVACSLVLIIWLLASCTEPPPDCQAPWVMVNSSLACPASHYATGAHR